MMRRKQRSYYDPGARVYDKQAILEHDFAMSLSFLFFFPACVQPFKGRFCASLVYRYSTLLAYDATLAATYCESLLYALKRALLNLVSHGKYFFLWNLLYWFFSWLLLLPLLKAALNFLLHMSRRLPLYLFIPLESFFENLVFYFLVEDKHLFLSFLYRRIFLPLKCFMLADWGIQILVRFLQLEVTNKQFWLYTSRRLWKPLESKLYILYHLVWKVSTDATFAVEVAGLGSYVRNYMGIKSLESWQRNWHRVLFFGTARGHEWRCSIIDLCKVTWRYNMVLLRLHVLVFFHAKLRLFHVLLFKAFFTVKIFLLCFLWALSYWILTLFYYLFCGFLIPIRLPVTYLGVFLKSFTNIFLACACVAASCYSALLLANIFKSRRLGHQK